MKRAVLASAGPRCSRCCIGGRCVLYLTDDVLWLLILACCSSRVVGLDSLDEEERPLSQAIFRVRVQANEGYSRRRRDELGGILVVAISR